MGLLRQREESGSLWQSEFSLRLLIPQLLLFCAALLAFPAVAAAQPTPLAIQRVWTQDAGGNVKNTFAPGEPIQFAAQLSNSYGGALSSQLSVSTGFYNDTKAVSLPAGSSTWTWNSTVPSAGSYTLTVNAYDSFYGSRAVSSANFTASAPGGSPTAQSPGSPGTQVTGSSGGQSPQSAGQANPGPVPAWYRNTLPQQVPFSCLGGVPSDECGVGALFSSSNSSIRISWKDSYIYRAPGDAALYWYAQVEFRNIGSAPQKVSCSGRTELQQAQELMSGTPNAGYVTADQTFCKANPDFVRFIEPGGAHYEWAIFHNVPWNQSGSVVQLGCGPYGFSSPPVDLWSSRISPDPPAPAECPPELVNLGTCHVGNPQGAAPNLIVLVHGCCTDSVHVGEWNAFADTMIGELIESKASSKWEIVVWDWTHCHPADPNNECTPPPPNPLNNGLLVGPVNTIPEFISTADKAYTNALDEGPKLAAAIIRATSTYDYIHLIGHSAGAKLINQAANDLTIHFKQTATASGRPFMHLTFLDAYTRDSLDVSSYGNLPNYPEHFAEHYVDVGLSAPIGTLGVSTPLNDLSTDAKLKNAYNFDITDWQPLNHAPQCTGVVCPQQEDEKNGFGHQWPRYWYQKSATAHWNLQNSGFRFGYPLSREGGNTSFKSLSAQYPPGGCLKLNSVTQTAPC